MLKSFEQIVKDVYTVLTIDGVKWAFDGKKQYVTQENVTEMLQRGLLQLYGDPPASSFLIGGILIYKWDEDKYDIYVRRGEVSKEDVESQRNNNN